MFRTRPVFTSIGTAMLFTAAAAAQTKESGVVSGVGTATVKGPAQTMRVSVELSALGKDAKEALDKLKERRQTARDLMVGLGVVESSIKFDEPNVKINVNDRQRQLQMMVQSRMRGRGKAAKKEAEKQPPVAIAARLHAEWKLKGATAEELLVEAHALEQKIRAADLSGSKEAAKTEEAEEVSEEMEELAMQMAMADDQQQKPGEPTFIFVRAIAAEEQAKATADAFAKAKANALNLAKSAGAELGPLRSLESAKSGADASDDWSDWQSAYYYQMRGRAMPATDASNEAVGPSPSQVQVKITVTASFNVKE